MAQSYSRSGPEDRRLPSMTTTLPRSISGPLPWSTAGPWSRFMAGATIRGRHAARYGPDELIMLTSLPRAQPPR